LGRSAHNLIPSPLIPSQPHPLFRCNLYPVTHNVQPEAQQLTANC
jgi:hypothetical protein